MRNYPNKRKHSEYAKCPICGKTFTSMGMGAHIRQAHQTVIKTIAIPIANSNSNCNCNCNSNSNLTIAKPLTKGRYQEITTPLPRVSDIIGKDMTECQRSDGQHLYTDTDLKILMGRICQVVLNTDMSNLIGRWDTDYYARELIADFELKFECKFCDVKKANPDVRPGKTDAENWRIASEYAYLKYSR